MDLLDKMATYVRVLEAGSLTAAAKQLRISSAAVSRQLATLEAELGVTLLLRSTRRMTVTPVGQRYYERCLRILREVDEAQSVGRGEGVRGVLKVNAPVSFGLAWLVPRTHALMTKHPRLKLDLRLEDRLVDLVLDDVDVALRVGGAVPESTELVAHKLFSFRRVVVASPQYVKRHGEPKSPEALARHTALTHAVGSDSWTLLDGEREARASLDVALRSNALLALYELAVRGAGVALLPAWFVADALERRELVRLLPAWQSEPVVVQAVHRAAHRGELRVRALLDFLKAEAHPTPGRAGVARDDVARP